MFAKLFRKSEESAVASWVIKYFDVAGAPAECIPAKKDIIERLRQMYTREQLSESDFDVLLFGYVADIGKGITALRGLSPRAYVTSDCAIRICAKLKSKFEGERGKELVPLEHTIILRGYDDYEAMLGIVAAEG